MRRSSWRAAGIALAVAASALTAAGAMADEGPTSTAGPDHARYSLRLDGDDAGTSWKGTEKVSFRNTGDAPLRTVWLRLWGNGSGGCDDTAVRLTRPRGGELGEASVGCTAVPVTLRHAAGPGRRATVSFDVSIDVPDKVDRFGRAGKYNFLGNAVPLLAVKDARGWQLPPYVSGGESFYSLTSDFSVSLRHSDAIAVPSTGHVVAESHRRGRTTTVISAPRVRDFAWAAGPFHRETDDVGGVRLNTWYPDDVTADTASDVSGWARQAMDGFSDAYGDYPYAEMDTVVGDWPGFGGMEYPNFILSEPQRVDVVHETGHQWFYGLVGDDEYDDPWIDESVTQYITVRVTGIPSYCDTSPFWFSDGMRIDAGMDYYGDKPDEYAPGIYGDGACMFHELEGKIGADAMTRALAALVRAHRYGVVTSDDLRAVFAKVSGTDLTDFWQRWRNTGA
ncbi:MAG TPA: M1 family metallopeptidase [Stackebrandtia sp.]|jgi:hypothetical protein|uniref:M1 family metallopeptidase n=1 Tax=Stackebrandtia sp. TaxID=2023065 RepID=UPI002D383993|nr:M1 family metallopeptidase [Stackebrandtia sp.]HZE40475.1 M1 family metallopeptidase [Stackebrandtia sp.]